MEDKFETLIAKTRTALSQKAGNKDKDLVQAEIDAEVTRLKDAWSKELDALEEIREPGTERVKIHQKKCWSFRNCSTAICP